MQIWGCTKDESNHIVHEFFKSQHFAVGVLPMPGMLDPIQALSAALQLYKTSVLAAASKINAHSLHEHVVLQEHCTACSA